MPSIADADTTAVAVWAVWVTLTDHSRGAHVPRDRELPMLTMAFKWIKYTYIRNTNFVNGYLTFPCPVRAPPPGSDRPHIPYAEPHSQLLVQWLRPVNSAPFTAHFNPQSALGPKL